MLLASIACNRSLEVNSSVPLRDTIYYAFQPGYFSPTTYYLIKKDNVVFVAGYRITGGVLYLDLQDTLYFKGYGSYSGQKTYIDVTGRYTKLREIKEKNSYKINVKVKVCDEDIYRRYEVYQNRVLLDSIDFNGIDMSIYRPLIDKAYSMCHKDFKVEVKTFLQKYGKK